MAAMESVALVDVPSSSSKNSSTVLPAKAKKLEKSLFESQTYGSSTAAAVLTFKRERGIIFLVIMDRRFWTVFTAKPPGGDLQYIGHFAWRLRYEFMLKWQNQAAIVPVNRSVLEVPDKGVPGRPTEGAIQAMLSSPAGPRATRESVTASDCATTQHFKGRRGIGGAGREGHGKDPSRERATRNGQDRRGHALRGPVVRAQHMQQRISRERLIPAVDFATAGPIIDIAELRKSGGSVSAAGCRQVIASRAGAGGRIWGLGPSGWRVVPGTEVAKNLLESCSCQSGFKKP